MFTESVLVLQKVSFSPKNVIRVFATLNGMSVSCILASMSFCRNLEEHAMLLEDYSNETSFFLHHKFRQSIAIVSLPPSDQYPVPSQKSNFLPQILHGSIISRDNLQSDPDEAKSCFLLRPRQSCPGLQLASLARLREMVENT